MNVIFKHEIPMSGATLTLAKDARILKAGVISETIYIWETHDEESPRTRSVRIEVIPTGAPYREVGEHIDTVFQLGGRIVWHIYAIG